MPYIKQNQRPPYDQLIKDVVKVVNEYSTAGKHRAGQLNYFITKLLVSCYQDVGLNYQNHNEVIGLLECIKQEFYRRQTAPYEDIKIKENGDVSFD